MFVKSALEKLHGDREIKRSHNGELKKELLATLETIKSDEITDPEQLGACSIGVFELGSKSRSPSVQAISIDAISKLLAHGHFLGLKLCPDDENPHRTEMDRLLGVVADAFQGVNTDDQVQLQIIKTLLTAVSSSHIAVHETTLLNSVRTIYNIHLASKSLVNQTTARATLTQILSLVFSRMETAAQIHADNVQVRVRMMKKREMLKLNL